MASNHCLWNCLHDNIIFGHVVHSHFGKFGSTFFSTSHVHHIDLIGDVDVASDHGVGTHLKINVLIIQIVIVAIYIIGNGGHCIKNGESHARKHHGNKLG